MTIWIESDAFAIVLQTDADNRLRQVYFGEKLQYYPEYELITQQLRYDEPDQSVWNNAYTPSGTWNIVEPALHIVHADGNASTELHYMGHRQGELEDNVIGTVIELEDPVYHTVVKLYYKVYQQENVFELWSEIENNEKDTILLKKYASANLYFRNRRFYLTQFYGTWATEMQAETHELTAGIKTLDTKLGTRSHMYGPPSFMLSFDHIATEDTGKVLLANLAWSGNYRFDFERDRYDNLRLIAGINHHAAEYQLASGQCFETPPLVFTYSEKGKGAASRNLHRWARKYRVYDGMGDRMTLLNNWEATFFDFDENKLLSLLDSAKTLGVDLFLLDDGWFANKYPRNDDTTGLGDWQVNIKKLPRGLKFLTDEASKRGLKFGIWIEPEMVNPKSELYEQHLDWVIRQPNRKEYYYRHQLVLDLCNPEVQEHVFQVFDALFEQSPEIAYVKWDCNTIIYNAHSMYLEQLGLPQSHLYTDYIKGLYKVLDRIREKYPAVTIMLCSGGGSRVDYGALRYYNEFWLSDNTGPIDRIFMHWEYSLFYPANTLAAHVTDWNKSTSIKYRVDVASIGKLGFDILIDKLSKRDQEFCREAVANYNNFKSLVLQGDFYRLQSPYNFPVACMSFVNMEKDRAIVFAFLIEQRFQIHYSVEPILLKGFNPALKYQVRELNLYPEETTVLDETLSYTGDYLMKVGFNPEVTHERRSVVLEFYKT